MIEASIALLAGRGVVGVTGPDAGHLLDNIVTNDLSGLAEGAARYAGLLSPQGKILFDFFVVRSPAGFLLETALDQTAALAKRIGLYKLRAKVEIKDAGGEVVVASSRGDVRARPPGVIAFEDPREPRLGDRLLIPAPRLAQTLAEMRAVRVSEAVYDAARVALGVPEAGRDWPLGDTYPHEADFDLVNGVSFAKGCFIGQEVVARMQNKTVVRKRVVRVLGTAPLRTGDEVRIGDVVIGSMGTVAGNEALAMLRLDRAAEAEDKGQGLTAGSVGVSVDRAAMQRYRDAVAAALG